MNGISIVRHLSALTDAEFARVAFEYRDGALFRRIRTGNSTQVGSRAGRLQPRGYRELSFRGRLVKEHRVIWLLLKGRWPEHQIDHIDGDPCNNRIENLRDVPGSANAQNIRRPSAAGSRFVGVSFHPLSGKWQACIGVDRKLKYLGLYITQEEAHAAYIAAKAVLHPLAPEQSR